MTEYSDYLIIIHLWGALAPVLSLKQPSIKISLFSHKKQWCRPSVSPRKYGNAYSSLVFLNLSLWPWDVCHKLRKWLSRIDILYCAACRGSVRASWSRRRWEFGDFSDNPRINHSAHSFSTSRAARPPTGRFLSNKLYHGQCYLKACLANSKQWTCVCTLNSILNHSAQK